jgi:hypothetical protein
MNNLLDTLNISCISFLSLYPTSALRTRCWSSLASGRAGVKKYCTTKVKILLNATQKNPQVTKALYSQLGTSEAIRLLNLNILEKNTNTLSPSSLRRCRTLGLARATDHSSPFWEARGQKKYSIIPNKNKFSEWLAGLIDGDGSFLLSKKGYASLEITMDIRDEHALQIIKNVYGGSIKIRSGANALRYRLHHKSGLYSLINDVNGHIRNSNRLLQLNKICNKYDLLLIHPLKLNYYNGWLSGFFDADGSISINNNNAQLSISLSQKTEELLLPLKELYGGNIYIDRSSQTFKLYITKKETILNLLEYFKIYPSRSAKKNRIHLIKKYYEIKDLKAHIALPGTLLHKSWQYFHLKWLKYSAEDLN